MELVGSVPAEPLPMQILAMAHNAGKANQVSSCRTTAAELQLQTLFAPNTLTGLDRCHASAGCSDDLCCIG